MAEYGTVKMSTENSVEVASFDPQEDKNMTILRERTSNLSGKQQELQSLSVSKSLKSAEPFGTSSELDMVCFCFFFSFFR